MSNYTNTLFMGKVLLRYNSVKSTNLEAQEMLSQPIRPIEGTIIVAEEQTDGRGQRGNSWKSPSGQNLLSSFILYPKHLLPKQQFNLNIVTSLAVADLLQSVGVANIRIKWPNDMYTAKKKLAGILIQNHITNHNIQSSIIGIGINVNQSTFDPKLPNPTSISLELGKHFDLEHLLESLSYFLEKRYLSSKNSNGMSALRKEYTQLLFQYEKVATYLIDDNHQAGIIKGIDPTGKLILEMEEHTRLFDFQELRFVV